MKKRIYIYLSIFIPLFIVCLTGCHKNKTDVAPVVNCPSIITIKQDSAFNYKNYCTVEGIATANEIDTSQLGTHTLQITATSKNGSVAFFETKVNVVPVNESRNDDTEDEVVFTPCEEGTHRENGVCVPDKIRPETPEPESTPEPTPEPSSSPEPTPEPSAEPVPTPVPSETPEVTATPEPTPVQTPTQEVVATPEPTVTTPVPYVPEQTVVEIPDESIGHGIEYFYDFEYGDIFGAHNACKAKFDSMPYGKCYPSDDMTYYILEW